MVLHALGRINQIASGDLARHRETESLMSLCTWSFCRMKLMELAQSHQFVLTEGL